MQLRTVVVLLLCMTTDTFTFSLFLPHTPHTSPPSSPQLSLLCQHRVGPPLDQQPCLSRTRDWLHQAKNSTVYWSNESDVGTVCSLQLCVWPVWVVAFSSAAAAEASTSGLKRSPAVEGTLSTKKRNVMEWTSQEGISDCVVSLKVDELVRMRLCSFC